jgi:hypothetical protein
MPNFDRYIGIDYSGARTPMASLRGLRVYLTEHGIPPVERQPPPLRQRKYWSRRGIAEWLVEMLADGTPTIAGIDHAFSFPQDYFQKHGLTPDWPAFLDDFVRHWPTDDCETRVRDVREGAKGNGRDRLGRKGSFPGTGV